jgi:hypothetical protein
MDIKKYKRLLLDEFDYLAIHHREREKLLQNVQDLFANHLRLGLQPEAFFINLGSPRHYAKSLQMKETLKMSKKLNTTNKKE